VSRSFQCPPFGCCCCNEGDAAPGGFVRGGRAKRAAVRELFERFFVWPERALFDVANRERAQGTCSRRPAASSLRLWRAAPNRRQVTR
jgi:hypothetical protein